MVVTVKVAPIERWCDIATHTLRTGVREALLSKGEIAILTETMQMRGGDHGKFWKVEPNFQQWIEDEIRFPSFGEPAYVCEHMLEMD